jgi:hypothetical protein
VGETVEVSSILPALPVNAKATLVEYEPEKYWEFNLHLLGIPFALCYVEKVSGRYTCGVLE